MENEPIIETRTVIETVETPMEERKEVEIEVKEMKEEAKEVKEEEAKEEEKKENVSVEAGIEVKDMAEVRKEEEEKEEERNEEKKVEGMGSKGEEEIKEQGNGGEEVMIIGKEEERGMEAKVEENLEHPKEEQKHEEVITKDKEKMNEEEEEKEEMIIGKEEEKGKEAKVEENLEHSKEEEETTSKAKEKEKEKEGEGEEEKKELEWEPVDLKTLTGIQLETSDGEKVELLSLLQNDKGVLIFRRHFNCNVCSYHLNVILKNAPKFVDAGFPLVVIAPESRKGIKSYRERYKLDPIIQVYSDEKKKAFKALGFSRQSGLAKKFFTGKWGQLKQISEDMKKAKEGGFGVGGSSLGVIFADVLQQGGVLVVDGEKVSLCKMPADETIYPSYEELLEKCEISV